MSATIDLLEALAPARARSTWPTNANIGLESAYAVWMPIARFEPPTARVPRHAAGRPVSWACASAMNDAAPSCRVATTLMPTASRPSRRPRKLSPGTVNAQRTPGPADRVGEHATDGHRLRRRRRAVRLDRMPRRSRLRIGRRSSPRVGLALLGQLGLGLDDRRASALGARRAAPRLASGSRRAGSLGVGGSASVLGRARGSSSVRVIASGPRDRDPARAARLSTTMITTKSTSSRAMSGDPIGRAQR